jgi:CTP:phosphocholine cytidylyltransferase-like protein
VALDVGHRQALENTLKKLWTDNITGIFGFLRENFQFLEDKLRIEHRNLVIERIIFCCI